MNGTGMSTATSCEPWCKRPPDVPRDDIWVCPVCGLAWDREAMTERIVDWTRDNVTPTMTEVQLSFLRAFLNNPNAF